MAKNNIARHWPTALLGTLVAVILLTAVFSYQVDENQLAVVTTLGEVQDYSPEPGLHFRWPYPIQQIYTFDKRDRTFGGQEGQIEETNIADFGNMLTGIFVVYRISDAKKFFSAYKTIQKAEESLNDWMRGSRKNVFSQYSSGALFNTDVKAIKLTEICNRIQQDMTALAEPKGIEIKMVGINALNVPAGVTQTVFLRMVAERGTAAERFRSEGERDANQIRTEANTKRDEILANAQAEARTIQAEGDAAAAEYYKVFAQDPELAAFLRKLQALRAIAPTKTTLIFDDRTAPFDLFGPDALNLAQPAPQPQQ